MKFELLPRLRRRPPLPPATGRGVFDSIFSFLTINFMIVLMIHVEYYVYVLHLRFLEAI